MIKSTIYLVANDKVMEALIKSEKVGINSRCSDKFRLHVSKVSLIRISFRLWFCFNGWCARRIFRKWTGSWDEIDICEHFIAFTFIELFRMYFKGVRVLAMVSSAFPLSIGALHRDPFAERFGVHVDCIGGSRISYCIFAKKWPNEFPHLQVNHSFQEYLLLSEFYIIYADNMQHYLCSFYWANLFWNE